jgi:hypothetical protein
MPDPGLTDIQNTLDAISKSVLRLPESRPSQFAPEWVSAIGDLIRACDALALALAGYDTQSSQADALLAAVRAQRRLLFLVIAEADPDQAEFWTEEYRESERTAEAHMAAGQAPRFFTDQEFESSLRARWLGEDDA